MSEPPTIASENVELTSGTKLPILGLGTWQLRGRSAVNAVLRALEVGYRHVETATVYGNEEQVGLAVAQSGVRREDIFVTTKLPPGRAGLERETLEASLDALAFGYVDLWLIHWPPSGGARPDVWERLLELQAEGLTLMSASATTPSRRSTSFSARQVDYRRSTRSSGARRSSMRACSGHTGTVVCRSRVIVRSRPSTCATRGSFELPRVTA